MSIVRREMCVKRIFAQDLGFVWSPLQGDSGGFGVEVERRLFHRFAEGRQAFLRLIRTHQFFPT